MGTTHPALESLAFTGATLAVFVLFVDDEPMFDLTDLNLTHVVAFGACAVVAMLDGFVGAGAGSGSPVDGEAAASAATFWLWAEAYARVVVVGFCLHCLTPLEADLAELGSAFGELSDWATNRLGPALVLGSLA